VKTPRASFNELHRYKNRVILEIVYPEDKTLAKLLWIGFDMNAETVKPGMAGVYNRYVTDRDLYQVQKEAQSNRRGLWADPAPMLPWEWRRSEGAARVRVKSTVSASLSPDGRNLPP
jgi:endonuclease YncB( thermonuclease family)